MMMLMMLFCVFDEIEMKMVFDELEVLKEGKWNENDVKLRIIELVGLFCC